MRAPVPRATSLAAAPDCQMARRHQASQAKLSRTAIASVANHWESSPICCGRPELPIHKRPQGHFGPNPALQYAIAVRDSESSITIQHSSFSGGGYGHGRSSLRGAMRNRPKTMWTRGSAEAASSESTRALTVAMFIKVSSDVLVERRHHAADRAPACTWEAMCTPVHCTLQECVTVRSNDCKSTHYRSHRSKGPPCVHIHDLPPPPRRPTCAMS